MADFEPPSFSLGLDLHYDSDPQNLTGEEDDNELGSRVVDSDAESGHEPVRVLKRLRRGLRKPRETSVVDDDIEDFSSEDDVSGFRPLTQCHSMCSSSKVPLNGFRAVKEKKTEPGSNFLPSSSTVKSRGENTFPKPEVSPLRMFQLIDSDSDKSSKSAEIITGTSSELKSRREDLWKELTPIKSFHISTPALDELCEEYFSSVNGNKNRTEKALNGQSIDQSSVPAHRYFLHLDHRIRKLVCDRLPNFYPLGIIGDNRREDLWKEFTPIKSFHISTLALDELCEEYCSSVNGNKNRTEKALNGQSIDQSSVPAHRYFLHLDHRIRKLVRDRLPNFYPLGIIGDNGCASSSAIDYMGQFGNKEAHKQATKNVRKRANNSNGETSHDSPSWVDPKLSTVTTQRTRARKVTKKSKSTAQTSREVSQCVNAGSNGKWYMVNGRKVYNKNGQELTGQMAYRQYRRDRGSGKAKRKTSSKKKKS